MKRWMMSTNHKDIGTLYFMFGLWAGMTGSGLTALIRVELGQPGSLMGNDQLYNVVVTAHAILLIFFMVMPIMIGGFGNWLVPLMLGAPDMAFPRLNVMSFWLLPPAIILLSSASMVEWGVSTDAHYNSLFLNTSHKSPSVDLMISSLLLAQMSTTLSVVNIMMTITKMRGNKMTLMQITLLTLMVFMTVILLLLSFPLLAGTILMLLKGHSVNTPLFSLPQSEGLILTQYLSEFFGNPKTSILMILSFSVTPLIVKMYKNSKGLLIVMGVIYPILAVALLTFIIWTPHLFLMSMDLKTRACLTTVAILTMAPTGMKTIYWILTMNSKTQKTSAGTLLSIQSTVMFIVSILKIPLSNSINIIMYSMDCTTNPLHYVLLSVGAVYMMFEGFLAYSCSPKFLELKVKLLFYWPWKLLKWMIKNPLMTALAYLVAINMFLGLHKICPMVLNTCEFLINAIDYFFGVSSKFSSSMMVLSGPDDIMSLLIQHCPMMMPDSESSGASSSNKEVSLNLSTENTPKKTFVTFEDSNTIYRMLNTGVETMWLAPTELMTLPVNPEMPLEMGVIAEDADIKRAFTVNLSADLPQETVMGDNDPSLPHPTSMEDTPKVSFVKFEDSDNIYRSVSLEDGGDKWLTLYKSGAHPVNPETPLGAGAIAEDSGEDAEWKTLSQFLGENMMVGMLPRSSNHNPFSSD